ncbi:nucleolar protein 6-like [Glandiceps talaboti]
MLHKSPTKTDEDMKREGSGTVSEADCLHKMEKENDNEERPSMFPPRKKTKLLKGDLYKPPTAEELATLQETEVLYQSSLFSMQISELLSEVIPQKKSVEQLLQSVCSFLENLPSSEKYNISDQSWLPKMIKVPIIQEPYETKGSFHFEKPCSVKVTGSYPIGICAKPCINVDIAVKMSKGCLQEKDFLNFRYHRKRALYLAHIANHLQNAKFTNKIRFAYMDEDYFKPILILLANGEIGESLSIRLHVGPADNFWKLTRFHPDRNNIRHNWFMTQKVAHKQDLPTPHYNDSVAKDMVMDQCFQCVSDGLHDSTGMKEGVVLLKVWLHQRQLRQGTGTFTGFIMTMVVIYLMSVRKLNKLMSSYQVVKNTFSFLVNSDWTKEGISMCNDETNYNQPTTADFHKYYDVVFVDSSGYVNLCANVSKNIYFQVRHEARLSLQTITSETAVNSFHSLFMVPVPFIRKFDHIFHLSGLSQLKLCATKFNVDDRLVDYGGDYISAVLPSICELIEKALGKRVKLMAVKPILGQEWSLDTKPPHWEDIPHVTFGLLLDLEFSTSILDKGPMADAPEAVEFREFWGRKSELRRFQDANICEAVVWECASMAERRLICEKVIGHILQLHAGITPQSLVYLGGHLDALLKQPSAQGKKQNVMTRKDKKDERGVGDEENQAVMHAYNTLSKKLRGLEDLPLSIASIQASSAVCRYAEVIPSNPVQGTRSRGMTLHGYIQAPLPDSVIQWIPALKIICSMERSGKWPECVNAIHHVKAAFHIRLGQLLKQKHQNIVMATTKHLDVLQDGFIFRIIVAYPREVTLLKKVKSSHGLMQLRVTKQSKELEKEITALPQLTSALFGIQQEFSTFGITVRLAKRWVSSQLLLGHLQDEAVELLVAYIFLQPIPYTVPGSQVVGFLRFLHLLRDHDWQGNPLVVNLNGSLDCESLKEIQERFDGNRSQLPAMFISTPIYKLTSPWTNPHPSKLILQRIRELASKSLLLLEHNMSDLRKSFDFKQIFRPPLTIYDVIIHLKINSLPRHVESIDDGMEKTSIHKQNAKTEILDSLLPVVNFDPMQKYLQELQECFGDLATFFCDFHGGSFIAVVWKSTAFQSKPFQVSGIQCCQPKTTPSAGKEIEIRCDVNTVVEDFLVIGQGLVHKVEMMTEKWLIE